MTNAQQTRYTTGQPVEVLARDFSTPGFPQTWQPGTVENVAACDNGLIDITVRRADGIADVQRVGKRGGNKRLRVA